MLAFQQRSNRMLVAVGLALIAAVGLGLVRGGEDRKVAAVSRAALASVHVDPRSREGRCDDGRSIDQAAKVHTPWCTVKRALDSAPSGATIIIHGSSIPRIRVVGVQHANAPVTLRAADGEHVSVGGLTVDESSGMRFVGLVFTDQVLVRDASRIEISAGEVRGAGMWILGGRDVLIAGNRVHDIVAGRPGGSHAIRVASQRGTRSRNVVIRDNRIENLPDDAIQLADVENITIARNRVRAQKPGGFGEHADAIQVMGGTRIAIRGNDIRDVQHGLMFTNAAARDVTIEENLIVKVNGGLGLKTEGTHGMPGLRVTNNTFVDTRYGEQFRARGGIVRNNIFDKVDGLGKQTVAEHNLVAQPVPGSDYGHNPILERPIFHDRKTFELAPESPGRGTGVSTGK